MAPLPHLKTQQVAEALGVSVSTVKRWVDSGNLGAARTVGKHRLILAATAIEFARDRGLPVGRLEALADSEGRPGTVQIDDRTRDALVLALTAGRTAESFRLIAGAYASGGAIELGDRLIRPAMEQIGHHWEFGVLDIYEEHRATQLIESALRDLLRNNPNPAPVAAPIAIGSSPEGDSYTIPGLLCELVLRDAGWNAMNLGPNLPLDSLAKAVRRHRPGMAWLSISSIPDPARFLIEYRAFQKAAASVGAAVVLGGRALNAELRSKLVATSFGDCLAHLDEFARRWQQAALRPPETPTVSTTD